MFEDYLFDSLGRPDIEYSPVEYVDHFIQKKLSNGGLKFVCLRSISMSLSLFI